MALMSIAISGILRPQVLFHILIYTSVQIRERKENTNTQTMNTIKKRAPTPLLFCTEKRTENTAFLRCIPHASDPQSSSLQSSAPNPLLHPLLTPLCNCDRMATRYARSASTDVKKAMHEFKRGKLKSGRSGTRVRSRKQAVAIGLSQARRKGKRVPRKGRQYAA